ncbi:MAG: M14 family zinc carboxypeptidase [Gemmatimonadota bacterium]|nr:M14 family zinc carboxypeptidase [Gemmatimonadota bacterium]
MHAGKPQSAGDPDRGAALRAPGGRRPLRGAAGRLALLFVLLGAPPLAAQVPGPLPEAELVRRLDAAGDAAAGGAAVDVTELARSAGGVPIRLVRVAAPGGGAGGPSLLVVAGADATHLAGPAAALALVDSLAAGYGRDSAVTAILDRGDVLVIPRLAPDAAVAARARPVAERIRDAAPYDDDRDGLVDEDGPDDLNGDGLVTLMRIADPAGGWTEDEEDPGLVRPADPARGDRVAWRVLPEGRDDDGDGRWNEDPPGGVDAARNFPRAYPWFGEAAGDHPLAEPGARALAELLAGDDAIAAVYVLGPQDNLVRPWSAGKPGRKDEAGAGVDAGAGGERIEEPLARPLADDGPWFEEVARRLRDRTGRTRADTLAVRPEGGDPLSWAHYQMGRWAFGSAVWEPPALAGGAEEGGEDGEGAAAEDAGADRADAGADRADAGADEAGAGREDAGTDEAEGDGAGASGPRRSDPAAAERRALRWLRAHRPDGFVDWTEVRHPDFPDRRVEVGGFAPFARHALPEAARDSLLRGEVRAVIELASLLPRLEIAGLRAESLDGGAWRVTARIANRGFLPTLPALAARLGRPRGIRVELDPGGARIGGGRRTVLLEPLPGGGSAREVTWIVVGERGTRVRVEAGSPAAGSARQEVELR